MDYKFKVGDKVVIRDDLCVGDKFKSGLYSFKFTEGMSAHLGKETTITGLHDEGKGEYSYALACDGGYYYWTDGMFEEPKSEMVDHPNHYNQSKYETIDEMIILFGEEETMSFCKLNAYKYKARAMFKHNDNGKEDLEKADWYLTKYLELKNKCVIAMDKKED